MAKLSVLKRVALGERVARVAEESGCSKRTIQRWMRLATTHRWERLLAGTPGGRPPRLSAIQLERLRAELVLTPRVCGINQDKWTGSALSKHLRRKYKADIGLRRSRELISRLVPQSQRPSAQRRESIAKQGQERTMAASERRAGSFTFSDHELKRRALRKIQRLASSGLPFQPFASTLFDLLREAVPLSGPERILVGPLTAVRWFVRNLDPTVWFAGVERFTRAPGQFAGMLPFNQFASFGRAALRGNEIVYPGFFQSEIYNELYKPLGIERSLITIFRDKGELIGLMPLSRASSMRDFGPDDILFVQSAVAHMAHGMRLALLASPSEAAVAEFGSYGGPSEGVVLMKPNGDVVALDNRARSIFHKIGVFDDLSADAFAQSQVKSSLQYIAKILCAVFFEKQPTAFELDSPVVRIYSHRTGVALKLRGYLTFGDPDQHCFTVIVEEGETAELRHKRIMYRYGVSRREVELLGLVAARERAAEIAARMSVTTETARTYLKRLTDKLELTGRRALVEFAQTLTRQRLSRAADIIDEVPFEHHAGSTVQPERMKSS